MNFWLYFLSVYVALVLFTALGGFFVKLQRIARRDKQKWTALMVRVPKENELGPLVAEQILSTFHSIRGSEQVSLEIANIDQIIRFYVVFPKKLRNLVEGQIYAQYPDVEIEEIEDYATESKIPVALYKNAMGMEMELTAPDFNPIKRYPQFEDRISGVYVDPIAGVTASLAKLNEKDDQIWLQFVVKPLADKWRVRYMRAAWIMSKRHFLGIEALQHFYVNAFLTRKAWLKVLLFPVYFYFWLEGLFIGLPKDLLSVSSGDAHLTEEGTSKSHDKETANSARMDKIVKLLYDVNVRAVYLPKNKDEDAARGKLQEVAGSFRQFNIPYLNSLDMARYVHGQQAINLYRMRFLRKPLVLNSEELATVWHLPGHLVQTPLISWVKSRKLEPPTDLPTLATSDASEFTLLGRTNFRGMHGEFGIRTEDRRRHIYIIGKTGMGKSTLLENMIFSDIQAGKGVGVIDPHGDLAEAVLDFIPASRTNDVIVIDPSDRDFPIGFNMLETKDPILNSITASGLISVFKKLYGESWGPRLEHILRNTILALTEYPNSTMLGIMRILSDNEYRSRVMKKITDPMVKSFWTNEFMKFSDKQRTEAIAPIQNKVGQFLSSPIIRNIVGQPKSDVDFRFAMDKGKIVVVNLSKGRIGEDNSALLGSMFITKFQLDAMSRANIPAEERRDFYLYVDEFQNFATDSFVTILSEARKYKLNLTLANQYIAQMPEEVRDAVFGNVGTITSFQVGFDDAEYIANQFGDEEYAKDLVGLSKYTAYLKLLVDGMPTKTFSMATLPPPDFENEEGRREKVVKVSRERYGHPREMVEDKIQRWSMAEPAGEARKDSKFKNEAKNHS